MSQTMQTAAPVPFMQRINNAAAAFISTLKQLPIPILHRPRRPSMQIQADAQQRKNASVCGGSRLRRGAMLAAAVLTATFALAGPSQAQAEILSLNHAHYQNIEAHQNSKPGQHQLKNWNDAKMDFHMKQIAGFYASQDMQKATTLVKSFKLENLSPREQDLIKTMERQINSYNHIVGKANVKNFGQNMLTYKVVQLTQSGIPKHMQAMDNYLTAVKLQKSISKAPPPPPKPKLSAQQERSQKIRANHLDRKIMKENMDRLQRGQNFAHQPPPQQRGPHR